jgi:Relaxase/Mobilisation nuclease domain
MIAKRIFREKAASDFERLGAYVLNARGGVDPASWSRLGAYVLDEAHQGQKVAWARVTNCQSDDAGWAVKEILATQARNTRSQADKSYHLVVSFPEGERPTRDQLADIEDRLCEALGFAEHQRVSAVHQNTDNWHMHVAINKVHPKTYRNVEPFRDHFRLQEACAELEVKHGLIRDNHTPERGKANKAQGKAADFEAFQGYPSFLQWVRENAGTALLNARDGGQGWQGLHRVASAYDLEIKPRGAGLVIGDRSGRLHVKASDVDRGLSIKALTELLGPYERAGEQARAERPQARYTRPERTGPLYEAFKREREAAIAAREAAAAALRERHLAYRRQLQDWYRRRFRQEKLNGLSGALRRQSFQHLIANQEQDRARRLAREAEERRQLRARHPIPSWQGLSGGRGGPRQRRCPSGAPDPDAAEGSARGATRRSRRDSGGPSHHPPAAAAGRAAGRPGDLPRRRRRRRYRRSAECSRRPGYCRCDIDRLVIGRRAIRASAARSARDRRVPVSSGDAGWS